MSSPSHTTPWRLMIWSVLGVWLVQGLAYWLSPPPVKAHVEVALNHVPAWTPEFWQSTARAAGITEDEAVCVAAIHLDQLPEHRWRITCRWPRAVQAELWLQTIVEQLEKQSQSSVLATPIDHGVLQNQARKLDDQRRTLTDRMLANAEILRQLPPEEERAAQLQRVQFLSGKWDELKEVLRQAEMDLQLVEREIAAGTGLQVIADQIPTARIQEVILAAADQQLQTTLRAKQQAQLDKLAETYGPQHPRYREAQKQLAKLTSTEEPGSDEPLEGRLQGWLDKVREEETELQMTLKLEEAEALQWQDALVAKEHDDARLKDIEALESRLRQQLLLAESREDVSEVTSVMVSEITVQQHNWRQLAGLGAWGALAGCVTGLILYAMRRKSVEEPQPGYSAYMLPGQA